MIDRYMHNIPANARVLVDYTKKNPRVQFAFPENQKEKGLAAKYHNAFFRTKLILVIGITWVLGMLVYSLWQQKHEYTRLQWQWYLIIVITILTIIFIPQIMSRIFVKLPNHAILFPKMNAHYDISFHLPRQRILTNYTKKTWEIPCFHNIKLSYWAKGDYAKHLQKIEVKEHEFDEEEPETTLWKAIFTWTKIPKKGYLKVEYK